MNVVGGEGGVGGKGASEGFAEGLGEVGGGDAGARAFDGEHVAGENCAGGKVAGGGEGLPGLGADGLFDFLDDFFVGAAEGVGGFCVGDVFGELAGFKAGGVVGAFALAGKSEVLFSTVAPAATTRAAVSVEVV